MPSISLRERLTLDSIPKPRLTVISFHHPGYSDELDNILFQLNGFDSPEGGLHHRTAWLACAIVAGNAWHGYLTAQPESSPALLVGPDEVLTGSDYWFHVPPVTDTANAIANTGINANTPVFPLPLPMELTPYPIVPSFQDWQFPHSKLPPGWVHPSPPEHTVPQAPSNFSATIRARDQFCRITQCRDCTDAAHVCPRSEHAWFHLNKMRLYNMNRLLTDTAATNDERNALLLRRDLHADFDDGKFVIVPKGGNGEWVVHLIEVTHELGKLYHNVPTYDIGAVAPEFLLTRFAWVIFPWLRVFLTTKSRRWLIRSKVDAASGEMGWMVDCVTGDDCRVYLDRSGSRSQSRSQSPKKRYRGEMVERSDHADDDGSSPPSTTHCGASNAERSTSPDTDAEYAEDVAILQECLPAIINGDEVAYSGERLWREVAFYPGWRRVERIKEVWLARDRQQSGMAGEPRSEDKGLQAMTAHSIQS